MPDPLEAVAKAIGREITLGDVEPKKAWLRAARAAVQALAELDLPDVVVGLAAYEASCECAPAEAAFRAMCRVLASEIPLPAESLSPPA